MQKPLLSPDAFHGLDGVTHLCTGGEAPWLRVQTEAYCDFARLKSGGDEGRREIYRRGESCRSKMGRLWEVEPKRVGFTPSAAEGMSWLARGLDWRKGDNVVTTNLEFPSVAYAWRNLKSRGVDIRFVPHRDWSVPEDDLVAAVDDRTRVLAVSQVSFYTGQCLDIEALSSGLRRPHRQVVPAEGAIPYPLLCSWTEIARCHPMCGQHPLVAAADTQIRGPSRYPHNA